MLANILALLSWLAGRFQERAELDLINNTLPAADYTKPLQSYADQVNSANIPYDMWNMNSNSFANSALEGVVGVTTDTPAPKTPGWNNPLPVK